MTKYREKLICYSCDISVCDEQRRKMMKELEGRFPAVQVEWLQLKKISLKSYFSKSRSWDLVVVFFAGYGMERYGANLWKHLLFFPRKLYGVNIDGHIFEIPRFSVFKLLVLKLTWDCLSKFSGKIYEVALSWYIAPPSSHSRSEH